MCVWWSYWYCTLGLETLIDSLETRHLHASQAKPAHFRNMTDGFAGRIQKFLAKTSKDFEDTCSWNYSISWCVNIMGQYYIHNWWHLGDNICVWAKKNGEGKKVPVGNRKIQQYGVRYGCEDIKTFFLLGLFQPDSGGLFGMEESNNLHLFPLVPRLMKNAFTTCFALTGFSGGFWSLATCHLDWSRWKYDVQVMAFSASSICCCVIEAGLAKGI